MPCDERKLYHAEENRYKESPRSHRPVFAGHRLRFNAVYGKYFTEKPARSCVAVKTLPKNVLVEVEVIAAL